MTSSRTLSAGARAQVAAEGSEGAGKAARTACLVAGAVLQEPQQAAHVDGTVHACVSSRVLWTNHSFISMATLLNDSIFAMNFALGNKTGARQNHQAVLALARACSLHCREGVVENQRLRASELRTWGPG